VLLPLLGRQAAVPEADDGAVAIGRERHLDRARAPGARRPPNPR
jgi:hypothetical protein